MSRPHRVLWLAKGLGRGGAEQLLVSSAGHLDRGRFQVEVAYLLPHKDALVPQLRSSGLVVHCLQQTGPTDLRWVARLRQLARARRYDLVHTHMPVPAALARLALLPGAPAFVHTEHNVWQRYRLPTYWANALTYRRNAAVIAVSRAVADSVLPRWSGRGEVEVLHHGVELASMHQGPGAAAEGRRRLGLPGDAVVVGTVGNCTPKKDQETLLLAFAALLVRVPAAHLVVVGSGPLEQQLRDRAAALGLLDRVLWTGMRDDVPELLPAFDVFVLSSLHEGLSIALVEALASGVPAVCTKVGGIPEVITDGVDGLLVRPGSATDLAAALQRVLQDDGLRDRLSRAGLARARHFDIGRATVRIEEIYDEVLAVR